MGWHADTLVLQARNQLSTSLNSSSSTSYSDDKDFIEYIAMRATKDWSYQYVGDAEKRISDIISKDFLILTSAIQNLNADVKNLDTKFDVKISALGDKVSKLEQKVDVDFNLAKVSALAVLTYLAMSNSGFREFFSTYINK